MAVVTGDTVVPVIWENYKEIIKKYEPNFKGFEMVERFNFYEELKSLML